MRKTVVALIVVLLALALLPAATPATGLQSACIFYRWPTAALAAAEFPWLVQHYQFFDCGSTDAYRSQLRSMTTAPMVRYANVSNVDVAGNTPEWQAMQRWCTATGVPIERMFLHAANPYTFKAVTYPAGNRLCCFWPNRFVLNVAAPEVQAWCEYAGAEMKARMYPLYSGIFVDNGWFRVPLLDIGLPVATGTKEGLTDAQWLAGLAECIKAVKRGAGGGLTIINTGNYSVPATSTLVAAADGWLGELWIRPLREFVDAQVLLVRARDLAGKISILHARLDVIDSDPDRGKILALALYYVCSGEHTYLFAGENYGGKPYPALNWYGALDVDIGKPLGEPYKVAGQPVIVWARVFTGGLVIAKPLPRYNSMYTDSTLVPLPAGTWRAVHADGTLGNPVSGTITLRNAEGAVLVSN